MSIYCEPWDGTIKGYSKQPKQQIEFLLKNVARLKQRDVRELFPEFQWQTFDDGQTCYIHPNMNVSKARNLVRKVWNRIPPFVIAMTLHCEVNSGRFYLDKAQETYDAFLEKHRGEEYFDKLRNMEEVPCSSLHAIEL